MFTNALQQLWETSGFFALGWQHLVMLTISFVLLYFAVVRKFEPLLLLPIAFGILLANLPLTGLMGEAGGYDQPGGLLYYLYQGVKLGIYPSLIFLGIGVLMIVAAQAVKMVIYGALDWKLLGLFTAVLPFVGLTGPCIMLPAIFKFGVEKGRGIFYAVIIVVCALYGAVGAIGADSNIMVFLLTTGIWIVPAFFAAGLLLLWGSWRLSIKFYENREL